MTDTHILTTRDLSVGYPGKTVLESVNLDVATGEFTALLGPNGAGKSTLLRTLSRLLPALSGGVTIGGKALETIPSQELAKTMSVVLTHKAVPPLFRAYDFVAMGRYPHTAWTGRLTPQDDRVVAGAMAMVRAERLMLRYMDTLSDGERQKVLIARALAQEPDIILLDEPTMHLDLKHRMEIMSILKNMCGQKGISVLASLHDIEVAARVSDRVALISGGTVNRFGPPEDVLQEDTVAGLYDFREAGFSPLLGSIEFRTQPQNGRVFVVGGMGSASVLYRLLCKKGFEVKTGVLLKNDVDFHVAQSLDIQALVQPGLEPVTAQSVGLAADTLKRCDAVVDAGFETAPLNKENLGLITLAKQWGKPVFRLNGSPSKDPGRPKIPADMTAGTESQLVGLIRERLARPAETP